MPMRNANSVTSRTDGASHTGSWPCATKRHARKWKPRKPPLELASLRVSCHGARSGALSAKLANSEACALSLESAVSGWNTGPLSGTGSFLTLSVSYAPLVYWPSVRGNDGDGSPGVLTGLAGSAADRSLGSDCGALRPPRNIGSVRKRPGVREQLWLLRQSYHRAFPVNLTVPAQLPVDACSVPNDGAGRSVG